MRINKECTALLLNREIGQLEQQCERCAREANKFAGFALRGMTGSAAHAAEERVRMRSALANAHLVFFRSLLQADRANLGLVEALPTTSPGMLDTSVAQQRIDDARRQIQELSWRKEEALAQARWEKEQEMQECEEWFPVTYESISYVGVPYDRLMALQNSQIEHNSRILERAREYEQRCLSLYQGVQTSLLDESTQSVESYAQGNGWGQTRWIDRAVVMRRLTSDGRVSKGSPEPNWLQRFANGELVSEGALLLAATNGTYDAAGIGGTYGLSGAALGYEGSLAPYGKNKREYGKDDAGPAYGAELEADLYGAQGSAKASLGMASLSDQTRLLEGVLSGALGLSLGQKGQTAPAFEAKASADGSVLARETSGKIGSDDYNYHLKAEGHTLTATAEAKLSLGGEGFSSKAGAEAYLATGELSTGITFVGVKVDVALEAKAGGAGGNVGVELDKDSLEGMLGIGLGLGLGAKVKVDWSGFFPAMGRLRDTAMAWWNGLERGV